MTCTLHLPPFASALLRIVISGLFSEAKSARKWLRHGTHVVVDHVLGFLTMFEAFGWQTCQIDKCRAESEPLLSAPQSH